MLELPTFVLLPSFYSRLGLSLTAIGAVLFLVRALDAFLDPYLGQLIDRSVRPYRHFVFAGLPVACLGFFLSFHPMVQGDLLLLWLLVSSILTYFSYSLLSIAYQAWTARLGVGASEKARLVTWREGLGLGGVLCASTLLKPELIATLTMFFFCMALIAALLLHGLVESRSSDALASENLTLRQIWALPWRHVAFGKLLLVFVFNGVASAIPATLLVFYVKDILLLSDQLPWFLSTYFAAAALGMSLWLFLGKRLGLAQAWMIGMLCAILGFAGASTLGAQDLWPFLVICGLTGLTLGADLALPSALLAVLIEDEKKHLEVATDHRLEASYFGLWSLASKANLALAAGLGLPLLALFGYQASTEELANAPTLAVPGGSRIPSLLIAYAVLPCFLKMIALACLWRFRSDLTPQTLKAKPC